MLSSRAYTGQWLGSRRKAAHKRNAAVTRRILGEVDQKPGLDPSVIDQQAAASVRRMRVIDTQPSGWRALLNDFPHQEVAAAADYCATPEAARRALESRLGKPL